MILHLTLRSKIKVWCHINWHGQEKGVHYHTPCYSICCDSGQTFIITNDEFIGFLMFFELFLGLRYLKAKRKQPLISVTAVISVLGVMLGVMALIVVLSVMNGFEGEIHSRIIGINAHVILLKFGNAPIKGYHDLSDRVEDVPGVIAAAPFTYNKGVLQGRAGSDQSGHGQKLRCWATYGPNSSSTICSMAARRSDR